MNKLRLSLFVLSLLIITNSSINAQDNEQNIRSNRTKTKTTTTTTTTSVSNPNKQEKDAFTLINGQTDTYNFGNSIKVGNPVEHDFRFKNNGTGTMHITNVSSSCGCTTPEWSNKPISPNGTGNIKVRYNSAAVGKFHKSITLTFQDQSTKTLWIQGEVIK